MVRLQEQLQSKSKVVSLFFVFYSLFSFLILIKFLLRSSAEPYFFGRYSLPYFIFLIGLGFTLATLGIGIHRTRFRLLKILTVNLIIFVICLIPIELGGQIYAALRPSYEVLCLVPDPEIGWKQVPGLHWKWAGNDWHARDFTVSIVTNSMGFRDLERKKQKPSGTFRIALLGDSFFEAIQVPFEQTSGHLLENKLNQKLRAPHEVLNFGISGFSVGQYLLVWEKYAAQFKPDYVFVFISGIQMERTSRPFDTGQFPETSKKELSVRPTFKLEKGKPVRIPPENYETLVKIQGELLQNQFDPQTRSRRHKIWFAGMLFKKLRLLAKSFYEDPLKKIQRNYLTPHSILQDDNGILGMSENALQINLQLLETLGQKARDNNASLIMIDAVRYFDPRASALSERLKTFCMARDFGYIPLTERLEAANQKGIPTDWGYDRHFNQAGNKVLADAMEDWILTHVEI